VAGVNSGAVAADGGDWAGRGVVSSGDFSGADAAAADGEAFGVKVGVGEV
jgi:hypothetical protein